MIKSMTGFGRSVGDFHGMSIVLELRSVNHKFNEISIKLPQGLTPLEISLKQVIRERFSRGRFDLFVSFTGQGVARKEVLLNQDLAKKYYQQLRKLKKVLGVSGEIEFSSILALRDILVVKEFQPEARVLEKPIKKMLNKAVSFVSSMRVKEGKVISRQLKDIIKILKSRLRRVEKRIPSVVLSHQSRLTKKISQLTGGLPLDSARLSQEVAYFAEKTDVQEELARLKSHFQQFDAFLKSSKPVGRSLDFLTQEMHREVNTLGAKANDSGISLEVIEMKGNLERIREQVQNIE